MLYLKDIKDWLKQFEIAEHYYIGKLDNKLDKSIGVYQRKTTMEPRRCIDDLASYDIKPVSILIHWNNDADDTEIAAYKLYKSIKQSDNVRINNIRIPYIGILSSEPIDVGTDDKGIYERVIELDLYYEKGEQDGR